MAKGFFTDTTVCIGCKACQVACHEWNQLPARNGGATHLTGESYDNTGHLNAVDWRHGSVRDARRVDRGGRHAGQHPRRLHGDRRRRQPRGGHERDALLEVRRTGRDRSPGHRGVGRAVRRLVRAERVAADRAGGDPRRRVDVEEAGAAVGAAIRPVRVHGAPTHAAHGTGASREGRSGGTGKHGGSSIPFFRARRRVGRPARLTKLRSSRPEWDRRSGDPMLANGSAISRRSTVGPRYGLTTRIMGLERAFCQMGSPGRAGAGAARRASGRQVRSPGCSLTRAGSGPRR